MNNYNVNLTEDELFYLMSRIEDKKSKIFLYAKLYESYLDKVLVEKKKVSE